MRSKRFLAPMAIIAASIGPAATYAQAAAPPKPPVARAADDGDGPLVFPALVAVRFDRTQTLIDRAARFADEGQPVKAEASLASARANLRRALTGTEYIIQHAPPPVAGADAFHEESFRSSGRLTIKKPARRGHTKAHSAAVGTPTATIYDTGFALLGLQHAVASTAIGLADQASGTLLQNVTSTVFTALNGRDQMIGFVAALPPDAPPVVADSVTVRMADDPGPTWASVMPGITAHVDDELQQIDGTMDANPTLRAGAARVLGAAEVQDVKTERKVNALWPAAADD